jgi:hypothetical protein
MKTPFWANWKRSEIILKTPRMEALRNSLEGLKKDNYYQSLKVPTTVSLGMSPILNVWFFNQEPRPGSWPSFVWFWQLLVLCVQSI